MSVLDAQIRTVAALQSVRVVGRVGAVRGLSVLVQDLPLPVGALVEFPRETAASDRDVADLGSFGEVVGFQGHTAIVMMLGTTGGVRAGDPVAGLQSEPTVDVGEGMLGRCINGLGRPIDGFGPIHDTQPRELDPPPVSALRRRRISQPLHTGIRAIDLFATIGRGQRMGIFAGPGVGKSTLLATIAKRAASDVNVIALIGERGREVRDFIEHTLGHEGLRRSVVVCSTGDESPLMRIRAAQVACAAAEHFRDRGLHVLLLVDSITRFAHAQRQVGLTVGEAPASKGYTPSVFAGLSRLLERAGIVDRGTGASPLQPGSITGLYTILVEGDDMTEPVSDAARGILDGHIILSRALAQRAHFPAIDILDSVSRVADDVCDPVLIAARRQLLRLLASYRDIEDLVQIGAYAKGSSPETDLAIAYAPRINDLLRQAPGDATKFEDARSVAVNMALEIGNALSSRGGGARRAG